MHATVARRSHPPIDHFRGFAGVWEIPADAPDARSGRWVDGFGAPLLHALAQERSPLPVIAEDLGVITPDVVEPRDSFGLPGMAVLQFGFGGPDNEHRLHHHRVNQVVYTGTHDNDTSIGWHATADKAAVSHFEQASGSRARVAEHMVRMAWSSVARSAVAPLQDLLSLGGEYRTNVPGAMDGNWAWRVPPRRMTIAAAAKIRRRLEVFAR